MLLHRLLPSTLFNHNVEEFIELCETGRQGEYLLSCWSELMDDVRKSGQAERLRDAPKVTAKSFPLLLDATAEQNRLVVVGAPPPMMTPQARFIGCWFEADDAQATLRYFAAEMSINESVFGDVLGEWTSDGSHRNFNSFCAPGTSSVELFAGAIFRLGSNGRLTLADAEMDSPSRSRVRRKTDDKKLRRDDVRARIAKRAHAVEVEPAPAKVEGPLSWESDPSRVASNIVGRLRLAQSAGQNVLIASAERATGLRTNVSTYLQFKVLSKKKLLTEVQGDYSYWGVSIQSREWTKFTTLGFASPTSSNGNFSMVYQDFRDDQKLLNWLTHTVASMQVVLAPEGEIIYKGF